MKVLRKKSEALDENKKWLLTEVLEKIKSVKIRTKLMVSVMMLLALMMVIGSNGVNGVIQGKNSIDRIMQENDILHNVLNMKFKINAIVSNLENIIDENKVSSKGYYKIKNETLANELKKGVETYKEVVGSQNIKEFSKFEEDINSLISESNNIIKLIDEKKYDEARSIYKKDIALLIINLEESSTKIVDSHEGSVSGLYKGVSIKSKEVIGIVVVVTVISIIFSYVIMVLLRKSLTNQLKQISNYAEALGQGNLNFEITKYNKDEIGYVIEQLNISSKKIRKALLNVKTTVDSVEKITEQTYSLTEKMKNKIEVATQNSKNISYKVKELNENSEEVTANTQEIVATTNIMNNKLVNDSIITSSLHKEAINIKNKGIESVNLAINMFEEKSINITDSLNRGKVVKEIEEMVKSVSGIASQINILALNASIEAARAGDNGKAFGVVAQEVRILAEETQKSAKEIQILTINVKDAFYSLSQNSEDLMKYLNIEVKEDYNLFIEIASKYGEDMDLVTTKTLEATSSTKDILRFMEEINHGIEEISMATNDVSLNSENVRGEMEETEKVIKEVFEGVDEQKYLVEKLSKSLEGFSI